MFNKKTNKNTSCPNVSSQDREKALAEELLQLMTVDVIKDFQAFLFEKTESEIKIAALNPNNLILRKFIKQRFGNNVSWFQATKQDIKFVLENCKYDFVEETLKLASTAKATNQNISRIIDNIIKYAVIRKSSDIHIEPTRNEVKVRLRIDGTLYNVMDLPKDVFSALITKIKILANLKIDEYRRPQDGRIEPEDLADTSLRVSIVPTLFGEKVALRILDDSNKNLSINELGLSKQDEKTVLNNMEKPFGMIISSGPTGSGKTTTLYALLQLIEKKGINVSTLEDPIEYTLDGVNQIQINPRVGLNFPTGLRTLLRQDPDIIMVGEIRDSETAIMAADAALTGHLVLTTLHTNDAASAFTRFLEMGVEDFAVASTINLVIGQRLLRKVCPFCAVDEKLNPLILEKIKERKDVLEALEKREKQLSSKIETIKFKKGKGCQHCFDTGYLGRIGIFEFLIINKEIHDLILKHESSEKIKKAGLEQGFKDMVSDGLEKVFQGKTTFTELLRTTKNN
jgi:type IV pilus assembly protein PilB